MKRLYTTLCILLLCGAPLYSQGRGIIQCDAERKQVPAWTAPGSAFLVDNLACNQTVDIVAFEKGFFGIKIGDRIAYIDSKNLKPSEGWEQQRTQAEAPSEPEAKLPRLSPGEIQKIIAQIRPRLEPRRHEGGLNFDVSHIYYDERDFMRNKGFMWGVSGDYTYRPNDFMLRVDGRFSFGNVDYWSNGTGTAENLRDYNFETRFSIGYDFKTKSKKAIFTPYFGIGYRYLFDGLSAAGPGGYDRKQHYLYSPMGMESLFHIWDRWSLGFTGEYDLFWHGWNRSDFEDAGFGLAPLKFDQKDGWGARTSIKIIRKFQRVDFIIEPYFRYWDIDDSDLDFAVLPTYYCDIYYCGDILVGYPYIEPANTTTEWGLRMGIKF